MQASTIFDMADPMGKEGVKECFLAMQGAAGEAVVMDDDEEEAADGPDPEPLAFPDALPIALVDESLPVSKPLILVPHSFAAQHTPHLACSSCGENY